MKKILRDLAAEIRKQPQPKIQKQAEYLKMVAGLKRLKNLISL